MITTKFEGKINGREFTDKTEFYAELDRLLGEGKNVEAQVNETSKSNKFIETYGFNPTPAEIVPDVKTITQMNTTDHIESLKQLVTDLAKEEVNTNFRDEVIGRAFAQLKTVTEACDKLDKRLKKLQYAKGYYDLIVKLFGEHECPVKVVSDNDIYTKSGITSTGAGEVTAEFLKFIKDILTEYKSEEPEEEYIPEEADDED